MYAQFRSQYPMGSLISELLNIHEGKYIVKAIIQVGGSTLATGLSAAPSIEQAEDQARARALVVLGIDGRPYATQAQIVNAEPEIAPVRSRARLSGPTTEFLPLGEAPFGQPQAAVDWSIADQAAHSFQGSEQQQQLSWLERDQEDGSESPRRSGRSLLGPEMQPFPASAPAQSSFGAVAQDRRPMTGKGQERASVLATPVDLSDIIAHTDIELKRLGWTSAQGRRYLEQTYGKRSRQHLSDAELMEFLDYLKTQPASGKSLG
jgi:hypothetical protein